MKTYQEILRDHRTESEGFKGIFFAFSQKQLNEGISKVGAKDTSEIYSLGSGGFILKARSDDFHAMVDRHGKELAETLADKKELIEALVYELRNHEYCITHDTGPALDVLGLDENEIDKDVLMRARMRASDNWTSWDQEIDGTVLGSGA